MNPNAPTLLGLDDAYGVYADAIVHHHETGALLFGSFWGRDTAIQELLARLTLGLAEGGLPALRLTDTRQPERTLRVPIEAPDQLAKLSGRMPAANLFGEIVHVWLYLPIVIQPDYAVRRALRVLRPVPGTEIREQRDAALRGDEAWVLLKEVSHLPLLDPWREAVLERGIREGWVRFHAGIGVSALEIDLGAGDEFEAAITGLIQAGTLTIAEEDGLPMPKEPPSTARGDILQPPETTPDSGNPVDPKRRLTAEELADALRHHTGTEQWFRHALVRSMLYTEGVQFFAEQGGQARIGFWTS